MLNLKFVVVKMIFIMSTEWLFIAKWVFGWLAMSLCFSKDFAVKFSVLRGFWLKAISIDGNLNFYAIWELDASWYQSQFWLQLYMLIVVMFL